MQNLNMLTCTEGKSERWHSTTDCSNKPVSQKSGLPHVRALDAVLAVKGLESRSTPTRSAARKYFVPSSLALGLVLRREYEG